MQYNEKVVLIYRTTIYENNLLSGVYTLSIIVFFKP